MKDNRPTEQLAQALRDLRTALVVIRNAERIETLTNVITEALDHHEKATTALNVVRERVSRI